MKLEVTGEQGDGYASFQPWQLSGSLMAKTDAGCCRALEWFNEEGYGRRVHR